MIVLLGVDGQVSSQFDIYLGHPCGVFTFTRLSSHVSHNCLQFIALESIVTSLSDIYPAYMRKGYRREVLLFLICACSYVVGQLFVSQVSSSCPPLVTRANGHVEDLPPEYSDEVHFCVLISGRHILSDDIRSLRMQRPCSAPAGDLPVGDYWMGLRWVAVAQSPSHIICASWRRGHFTAWRLQVRSASVATLQTWSGTNLTRWSNTAGSTAPLWLAL